jgi:hypothetical protein
MSSITSMRRYGRIAGRNATGLVAGSPLSQHRRDAVPTVAAGIPRDQHFAIAAMQLEHFSMTMILYTRRQKSEHDRRENAK